MRRLLPLLALPVLLAACGGGGGSAKQAASAGPCPGGAVTIHMADIKFAPAKASAKAGDTVCWVNDDDIQHDVVAENGKPFESALFGKGKTFRWQAAKAGTVKYVCTVHPGMDGELEISS